MAILGARMAGDDEGAREGIRHAEAAGMRDEVLKALRALLDFTDEAIRWHNAENN
jgi:hypothetical protein